MPVADGVAAAGVGGGGCGLVDEAAMAATIFARAAFLPIHVVFGELEELLAEADEGAALGGVLGVWFVVAGGGGRPALVNPDGGGFAIGSGEVPGDEVGVRGVGELFPGCRVGGGGSERGGHEAEKKGDREIHSWR